MTILNPNSMQLLSFLYTDIMYHFPALLRFSSMLWKTNAFLYLVSFRYPNTLDKPNEFAKHPFQDDPARHTVTYRLFH